MILRIYGEGEELSGLLVFAIIVLLDNYQVWSGVFQCPIDQDPYVWSEANIDIIKATIQANGTRLAEMEPRAQMKLFFRNNPAALQLFDLPPDQLEIEIENMTPAKRVLLDKISAYGWRLAREEFRPEA